MAGGYTVSDFLKLKNSIVRIRQWREIWNRFDNREK